MTFEVLSKTVGREAVNILELDLDRCSRSYGVAPCTAFEALQNMALQSETFDNATWIQGGNIGGVANVAANPLTGTMTADKIESLSAVVAEKNFYQSTTPATLPFFAIQSYTLSCYVTRAPLQYVSLAYVEATAIEVATANFDLGNVLTPGATLVSISDSGGNYNVTAGIEAVPGQNQWFRIWMNFTPPLPVPGTEAWGLRMWPDSSFTAGSVPVGDGIIAYGFQSRINAHNVGAFPTSSISPDKVFLGKYVATTTAPVDTATGMPQSNNLCFNTFASCQDTPNYNNIPQTYRFCDRVDRPPALIDAYPAMRTVGYGATKLDPGGGLAVRGKVTVTLQDFTTNDNEIDDYTRERTYDPLTQGTFFGKLIARNKFYIGRPMRVLEGYMNEPFTFTNFRTREYIIENIVGPDKTGKVQIIGKDPLTLAANNKAKAPTASVGTLFAGITAVSASLTVSVGDGPDYDIDPHVRVDDEIMLITLRVGDVLSVTRSQGGTTAATHDAGAAVQSCLTYTDEPVIDIIQNLLEDFANVNPSFIPFADWQTEEAASLTGYDLTTIISEPTGVQKLLKEIVEITLLDIWYSDTDQEIKLKLQTPFTSVTEELNDNFNVLQKTLQLKADNNRRLTRVLIYYGIRNFARDLTETENYSLANFEIEADKEGVNKFNDEKIKVIFSRWMDASNNTQIGLTSQRLLDRFGNMPLEIAFTLDAKDVESLQTGDVYDLDTRIIQGFEGLPEKTRFQVIETKPLKPSSQYKYKSLAFFADPNPDSITISANETDFDLFVELGGPPGPVDVTVTVDPGVFIRATNGNPAFKTDGMHPDSTINLINNGEIRGFGGNAGNGGQATTFGENEEICYFFGSSGGGGGGQQGGDALNITVAEITIDNTNGFIFGGGGGGGGGRGWRSTGACTAYGGGGGGGGIGTDTGNLGGGGIASNPGGCLGCGPVNLANGNPGTNGSEVASGVGGLKGASFATDGGDGAADWGLDGVTAAAGGAGGAGGFAVRLNGATINWDGGNTAAKVKGNVA